MFDAAISTYILLFAFSMNLFPYLSNYIVLTKLHVLHFGFVGMRLIGENDRLMTIFEPCPFVASTHLTAVAVCTARQQAKVSRPHVVSADRVNKGQSRL